MTELMKTTIPEIVVNVTENDHTVSDSVIEKRIEFWNGLLAVPGMATRVFQHHETVVMEFFKMNEDKARLVWVRVPAIESKLDGKDNLFFIKEYYPSNLLFEATARRRVMEAYNKHWGL